jgi:hypothetical protein
MEHDAIRASSSGHPCLLHGKIEPASGSPGRSGTPTYPKKSIPLSPKLSYFGCGKWRVMGIEDKRAGLGLGAGQDCFRVNRQGQFPQTGKVSVEQGLEFETLALI